jgi:hypothetical protein
VTSATLPVKSMASLPWCVLAYMVGRRARAVNKTGAHHHMTGMEIEEGP